MGHHRHPPPDLQNEQCRPRSLADTDPGTHRQPMAKRRNRRPHALKLHALNGLGLPLTEFERQQIDETRRRLRNSGLFIPPGRHD